MSSTLRLTHTVLRFAVPCLAFVTYSAAATGTAAPEVAAGVSPAEATVADGVSPSGAGERTFLVMLANSPKQFRGPDRRLPGLPTGGLPNMYDVHNQYFDHINPRVGSFAEYWEEISYGDVTIARDTADWINLPWAIQPHGAGRGVGVGPLRQIGVALQSCCKQSMVMTP